MCESFKAARLILLFLTFRLTAQNDINDVTKTSSFCDVFPGLSLVFYLLFQAVFFFPSALREVKMHAHFVSLKPPTFPPDEILCCVGSVFRVHCRAP